MEPGNGAVSYTRDVRSILVDTSTDLRFQALVNNIRRVDAILFTHTHADHVFGLDDVRSFNQMQRSSIPCYASAATAGALRQMFTYIFEPPSQKGGGIPQIVLHEIDGPFKVGALSVQPIPLLHGTLPQRVEHDGAHAVQERP